MSSFDSLGLIQQLVNAVHEKGYEKPTPIQSKAIPAVLAGRDVIGGAQTGTEKRLHLHYQFFRLNTRRGPKIGHLERLSLLPLES